MMHEYHGIPYRIRRRRIRYPRLEFRTGTLEVILPPGHTPEALLYRHHKWILRRYREIQAAREASRTLPLVQRDEQAWRELLTTLVQEAETAFRGRVARVQVRRMRTKWASCSPRGTLTLNRLARQLPDTLVRYLVHHEVVHLHHPHHRRPFWQMLRRTHPDPEAFEQQLFAYWFRLVGEDALPGEH